MKLINFKELEDLIAMRLEFDEGGNVSLEEINKAIETLAEEK